MDNPPSAVGYINNDGTKYFYLKDHIGSVRCVLNENNEVVSAYDYDAWGYVMENRTYESSLTKYKFTGKERDNESMYDYFGARYYDSRIGRWGGVEPLYDSYIQITPYNYSLNNPIKLVDVNGMDVRANSYEAQQRILNTLPVDLIPNIIFNEQGYIDKTSFNIINNTSGNFEALKQLVNDPRLFEVTIGNSFSYSDEYDIIKSEDFGPIIKDITTEPSPFSPQTGEFGFYGVTLIPGYEAETFNSPGYYIGIIINASLSIEGKAQTFSHEAYGHAYLYSLGEEHSHIVKNINGEFIETNELLANQIKNRINETIINMGR